MYKGHELMIQKAAMLPSEEHIADWKITVGTFLVWLIFPKGKKQREKGPLIDINTLLFDLAEGRQQ